MPLESDIIVFDALRKIHVLLSTVGCEHHRRPVYFSQQGEEGGNIGKVHHMDLNVDKFDAHKLMFAEFAIGVNSGAKSVMMERCWNFRVPL